MNKIIFAFTSGVVLGLLIAPAKGKETRSKIANIGDNCKQRWNNLMDKAVDKIDGVKNKVDDMAYNAVDKIENMQFETGDRTTI